ncbi:metallophosphoesterase [Cytobacillus sp. S13-E01]|uniref:metallophosphoesterase n=1 Tax=Cytobacillus sp. S13-E01 TaxID=3031326 RepID=UPI0023D7CF04|nr:metallophosphoesterase [Cytobacillus sp. S13-E01]MDF0726721.1 metallophosphoesterase [Cytobacillus sp. S13-E01]
MKALIISDSHGLTDELLKIKERHRVDVDVMIHCGDSELDYNSIEMKQFFSVRGNCDLFKEYPNELTLDFANRRVLVTHGHLYNVKMTLMNLNYRAKEIEASIVCFGHSHIAGAELIDNVLFINPGSIRLPKMSQKKTYAILEISSSDAIVTFYDLAGNIVESLTTVANIK